MKTALIVILCIVVGFIVITGTIYFFNLDMKLVRFIYDKLQPHYDNLEKDRKL